MLNPLRHNACTLLRNHVPRSLSRARRRRTRAPIVSNSEGSRRIDWDCLLCRPPANEGSRRALWCGGNGAGTRTGGLKSRSLVNSTIVSTQSKNASIRDVHTTRLHHCHCHLQSHPSCYSPCRSLLHCHHLLCSHLVDPEPLAWL